MEIFHQKRIDKLSFDTAQFESTICDEFEGLEFEDLQLGTVFGFNSLLYEHVLKQFSGKTDSICTSSKNPFSIEASKQMQMVLTRNMDIVVLHQSLKYDLNDVLNSDKCFRIRRLSKNQRCQYIFETLDSRSRQETGICEFRFYCIQVRRRSSRITL